MPREGAVVCWSDIFCELQVFGGELLYEIVGVDGGGRFVD